MPVQKPSTDQEQRLQAKPNSQATDMEPLNGREYPATEHFKKHETRPREDADYGSDWPVGEDVSEIEKKETAKPTPKKH